MSGVFISYRRSDSPDATGRLYDRLVSEFGKAQVFKDVDSIPLGEDFRAHLNTIVGNCGVVLAIVGPRWTDARDPAGQRRLEDPDDFVRIELEAALARAIPVVPVLVGHAVIPAGSQLPQSLAPMAFRQSIDVRPDPDFHNDATRLVAALRGILDPTAVAAQRPAVAAMGTPRNGWLGWLVASVAVLGMALLAIPAIHSLREAPLPESRVDIVTPVTDNPESFALSPDGRQIVFVAKGDGPPRLWLRSLAKATALPVAGTQGASLPFWSPDSRSIGFFQSGSLKRLDIDGGQPQTLAAVSIGNGGSWSTQGVIVFAPSTFGPFSRVAASGGATTVLPLLGDKTSSDESPLFLADGRHFLFIGRSRTEASAYLGSLEGGPAIRLPAATWPRSGATLIAYLPSGWLLWCRSDGALVGQRLDVAKGMLVGDTVSLADDVLSVSTSNTGVVAYRPGGQRQLTWVDRSGKVLGMGGPPAGSLSSPRVSPDGRQTVFSRETQYKPDLWLQEGARTTRLTVDGSEFPVWSPDGRRVLFVSTEGKSLGFFQKSTDGAQGQEAVLLSQTIQYPTSWSADGRYLLYFSIDPGPNIDLWVLPMIGTPKPFPFLQSSFNKVWGQFSPDGRWVTYQSDESGRPEIYVRRFVVPGEAADRTRAQTAQWQVSTEGGIYPTWRADGKELFYLNFDGMMMAAPISVSGQTIVPGMAVALFQSNVLGGGSDSGKGRQYNVAADGRFMINRVPDAASLPITLIQNWNPEARTP